MIGFWDFGVLGEIVSIASRESDTGRHRNRDVVGFIYTIDLYKIKIDSHPFVMLSEADILHVVRMIASQSCITHHDRK